MRLISAVMLMLVAALASGCVQAESGNRLLSNCESEIGTSDHLVCLGYIEAVFDTEANMRVWHNTPKRYCTPEAVTLGQLKKVVVKHI